MTKNKIALITGGGGFLATQHIYALSQLKCKIVLIDINKKKLINIKKKMEKEKISCEIFKADITKEKKIRYLNKIILKKFRKIDILINNASIDHIPNKNNQKFNNLKLKDWNKELEVGLTGAFLCSKIFGQSMQNKKKGIILNVASDLSIIAPDQRIYSHLKFEKPITYSVIKHGIIGLTKYLAAYWANQNIRVNSISPGGINNNQDKLFIKKLQKLIPMKRMANSKEYIGVIKFLCSEESSYITGQNIIVDGGRSII